MSHTVLPSVRDQLPPSLYTSLLHYKEDILGTSYRSGAECLVQFSPYRLAQLTILKDQDMYVNQMEQEPKYTADYGFLGLNFKTYW
jgi:hypothetical protein